MLRPDDSDSDEDWSGGQDSASQSSKDSAGPSRRRRRSQSSKDAGSPGRTECEVIELLEDTDSEAEVRVKDPLAGEEEEEEEMKILEEVERKPDASKEIACFNRSCKRSYVSKLAYYEHLSTTHFSERLLQQIAESQPKIRSKSMGQYVIICPECSFKSTKMYELISHFGIKHKVAKMLAHHESLLKRHSSSKSGTNSPTSERKEINSEKPSEIELDSDNDSIVELDKELCPYCGQKFETEALMLGHISTRHFSHGLLVSLLENGWTEGQVCPLCQEEAEHILVHFGVEHGRVRIMMENCRQGGEVRLGAERREVAKWCVKRTANQARVDILKHPMPEVIDTDSEINSENVDDLDNILEYASEPASKSSYEPASEPETEINSDTVDDLVGTLESASEPALKPMSEPSTELEFEPVSVRAPEPPSKPASDAEDDQIDELSKGNEDTSEVPSDIDLNDVVEIISKSSEIKVLAHHQEKSGNIERKMSKEGDDLDDLVAMINKAVGSKEAVPQELDANTASTPELQKSSHTIKNMGFDDSYSIPHMSPIATNSSIAAARSNSSTSHEMMPSHQASSSSMDTSESISALQQNNSRQQQAYVTQISSSDTHNISSTAVDADVPETNAQNWRHEGVPMKVPSRRPSVEETKARDFSGPSTICKICEESFSSRSDFGEHLATVHFRQELESRVGRSDSCPSCCLFKTKDPVQLLVHYGSRCRPFPVKRLYSNWLEKNKAGHSTDVCVFCDHKGHSPSDLSLHITERHTNEVLDKMGFRFLFQQHQTRSEVSGSFPTTTYHCPLCTKTDSVRRLTEHFMRRHNGHFLQSYQRFQSEGGQTTSCLLCREPQSSTTGHLQHLVTRHFSQQLLAECGNALDQRIACNTCPFAAQTEKEVTLHYGIEHGRADFFLHLAVLRLLKKKELTMTEMSLEVEDVRKDFKSLTAYLGSCGRRQELQLWRVLADRSHPLFRSLLSYSQQGEAGTLVCGICGLHLPSQELMVVHLGLRPHFKADILVRLEAVRTTRELTCKLCDELMVNKEAFFEHQATVHFFDDLACQLPKGPGGFCCPERNCGFATAIAREAVIHLAKVHRSVEGLYQKLQVTRQMLTCSMCKEMFKNHKEFKLHLAIDHYKAELSSDTIMLRSEDGRFSCSSCDFFSGSLERMVAHIGCVHNIVEELYRRGVTGEEGSLTCDLCGWFTCRQAQFLHHITEEHFRQALVTAGIIQHEGRRYYMCTICNMYWDSPNLLLDHVGRGLGCNQSLPHYFYQVDARSFGRAVAISTDAALERFRHLTDIKGGLYSKSWLASAFGSLAEGSEDPTSTATKMEYNVYTQTVNVKFRAAANPRYFKPMSVLSMGPLTCYFCDITGTPYVQVDRSVFKVHLAEAHFKEQLSKMFSQEGVVGWHCTLCSFPEEFRHEQQLHGHLAYNHDTIDGLYEAARPKNNPLLSNMKTHDPPAIMMISSLFPWLPIDVPRITSTVIDTQPLQPSTGTTISLLDNEASCRICPKVFIHPNRKPEVNRHYIQKHFGGQLERKYSSNLQGPPPFKCPLCNHDTSGQAGQSLGNQKFGLLLHVGLQHGLVQEMMNLCTSTTNKVPTERKPHSSNMDLSNQNPDPLCSKYNSPGRHQCMECHEDLGSLEGLLKHLGQTRHLNWSWAVQTNTRSEKRSPDQPVSGAGSGRWFNKLPTGYRCAMCPVNVQVIQKFKTMPEVFAHSIHLHNKDFQREYAITCFNYSLCKIGNCYIKFDGGDSGQIMKTKEMEHYLGHGRNCVASLGILGPSTSGSCICNLCSKAFRCYDSFVAHIKTSHEDEVLHLFREFSTSQFLTTTKPTVCCVCKGPDPGVAHLSRHNPTLLAEMGIIEEVSSRDFKTAKISCRCCKITETDAFTIIQHFKEVHKDFFKFLVAEYHRQHKDPQDLQASQAPVTCRLCHASIALQEFNNHLYERHYHDRVHSLLEKYPLRCPFCSPNTVIVIPGVKSLIQHCIEKHQLVQEYYREDCELKDAAKQTKIVSSGVKVQPTGKVVNMGNGQQIQVVRYLQPETAVENPPVKISCKECSKVMDSELLLREHLSKHHFALDLMTEMHARGFVTKHKEIAESVGVVVVKMFGCPEKGCDFETSVKNNIVLHLAAVHDLLDVVLRKRGKSYLLPEKATKEDDLQASISTESVLMAPTCPKCKLNIQHFSPQRRSDHLYQHLESKLAAWLRQNHPATAHFNDCPVCKGKFPDKPTVLKHLGSQHGLYDELIKIKTEEVAKKPTVVTKPGFSDAFAQFIQKESTVEPLLPIEIEEIDLTPAPVRNVKSGHNKSILAEDSCKICQKPFDDRNAKGELKSNGTKKAEMKSHYISHFRDKLVNKYPSSFQGDPPFTCAKCGFISKASSQHVSMLKQAILMHVANCQNELDTLIEQCDRRTSPSKTHSPSKAYSSTKAHTPSKALSPPKQTKSIDTDTNWRTSVNCNVCGEPFNGLNRNYHYANHFKKTLAHKFKLVLQQAPTVPCPFAGCKQNFRHIGGIDQQVEIAFFVHIGDHHDEFSNCGPRKFSTSEPSTSEPSTSEPREIQPPSTILIPERYISYLDYSGILAERYWSTQPTPCLVCQASLQELAIEARISHYSAHFQQLEKMFGEGLQISQTCFICSDPVSNETSLKAHLVSNHLKHGIEGCIELSEGGFKCTFCNLKSSNSHSIVQHLVNEELALEVELLKYLTEKKITPDNSYRKVHVEVIDEDEVQIVGKEKKVNVAKAPSVTGKIGSLGAFVLKLRDKPECLKCQKQMTSLNELMRHLCKLHYRKQVERSANKHFPDAIKGSDAPRVKCNICNESFRNHIEELAIHVGVDHRKVLRVHFDVTEQARQVQTEVIDLEDDDKPNIDKFNDGKINDDKFNEDKFNEDKGVSLGLSSFAEASSVTKTEQKEDFKELQRFLSRAKANQRVFIQKGPCYQLDPELPPCHECKKILQGSSLPGLSGGTCCCFEGFRKLQYVSETTKNAPQPKSRLTCIGFLDPIKDPKPTDAEVWKPNPSGTNSDLTEEVALFILQKIGDIFINMVTDEKLVDDSFASDGKQIIWKRPHPGIFSGVNTSYNPSVCRCERDV